MKDGAVHILAMKPARGGVTWHSEGAEGGRYHSRKLHVPSDASGLTIGRGYDMAHKNTGQIVNDLTKAGVSQADAERIAQGAGKKGKAAKAFIAQNHLEGIEISKPAQVELFNISYDHEAKEVRRISSKRDVVGKYGETHWDSLDQNIKDIVVDLKFRGDYTGVSREKIQGSIAKNDIRAFAKAICDRDNWKNVPADRFDRRRKAMEAAVTEFDRQEKLKSQSTFRPAGGNNIAGGLVSMNQVKEIKRGEQQVRTGR